MKIVIAIDSFKGSATSAELSKYASDALRDLNPDIEVVGVPVSDGGEGTVESIAATPGIATEWRSAEVSAPLLTLDAVNSRYVVLNDGRTAVMEMASASGLPLVPPDKRDVMQASTLGTGQMIADAISRGCREIILGLGGSATNDAGTGILAALGFEFLDNQGRLVFPCGGNLGKIAAIDDSGVSDEVRRTRFTLLCDVDNPLCGPRGSTAIYSPQKGATPEQVEQLEAGMRSFSRLMPDGVADRPGAGAAGGIGAGMMAFLDAQLKPGITTILQTIGFDHMVSEADLVITGEGRIDRQTMMGKAPAGILEVAKQHHVPTVAVCGAIADDCDADTLGFTAVFPIVHSVMTLDEAMRPEVTERNFKRTVRQIVKTFLAN